MKSAGKSKDFSIESILADTFKFFQNDQYRKSPRSSVSKTCKIGLQKDEKRERNSEIALEVDTGNKIIVNNSFESTEENPASNLTTNFEITSEEKDLTSNEYEFSEMENCSECSQEKSEVNIKEKEVNFKIINSKQIPNNQKECCTSLLSIEENDNDDNFRKVFDINMKVARLITREEQNVKGDRNLSVPFTQEKLSFNEADSKSKLATYTMKELVLSSENFVASCEEINERYCNIRTDERQKNVINLKEDRKKYCKKIEKKQLKQDRGEEFNSSQVKCVNDDYGDLLEIKTENSKIDFYRKLKVLEDECPLFDNRNKELIKLSKNKTESAEVTQNTAQLKWLQCTRYKPPKVPRKPAIGKNRRKPSLHPRIPFSTFQLDFLEQKFRNCAYLSKDDVLEISNVLNLPPNRVKIWFQNRRARERREFCTDK